MISGKEARRRGYAFEAKARDLLERDGWIVSRWNNNIDVESETIIKAVPNRFNIQPGFPDFVCLKPYGSFFLLKFVECKKNKRGCSPLERQKLAILTKITGAPCEVMTDDGS